MLSKEGTIRNISVLHLREKENQTTAVENKTTITHSMASFNSLAMQSQILWENNTTTSKQQKTHSSNRSLTY
jgi:hypothetical protein